MKTQEIWPSSDHDTLIEIRTLVSELKHDIKELQDGTHLRLLDHDKRIRTVEDLVIRTQPEQRIVRYDKVVHEWSDFQTRLKVYIGLLIALGGIVGAVASQLLRYWLDTHGGK